MQADTAWTNARLLTMAEPGLGPVEGGTVAAIDGRIVFAGPAHDAPPARHIVDCAGRWITPGLVDCHTHLVFAGDRSHEFERRLEGATYEAIAQDGGGIIASVRATRAATQADLVASAQPRLDRLIAEGVTTVEIKSGYGLNLGTERRMLQAARTLGASAVSVATTFLGAHTVAPEYAGDADGYVDHLCHDMLPTLAHEHLIDAVDAFCERIAFTPAQTARMFAAAWGLGLPVKLHADQLSNGGGGRLAAEWRALSADHLEHLDDDGAAALARAGTVAVLLPGAYYMLREIQAPPVTALRRHGARIALATDCNPGTSPLTSPLLAMNMGATLFRLTVAECLAGFTREAARALGRLDQVGTLEPGKWADLAIWDIERPAELVYRLGYNPLHARVWHGATTTGADA